MARTPRVLVGLCSWLALAAVPAAALANDPNDSISISAPVASHGSTIYAGYPFTISGSGTNDAASDVYDAMVLYTPANAPILQPACPADFGVASQLIDQAFGGPGAVASYEAFAVTNPPLGTGPYTYTAYVNSDTIPTLTTPGRYVACAYLLTGIGGSTVAATATPVAFTVNAPPGSGSPPGGFGGPRGTPRPSDVTLTVAPKRAPIRAPGRNLINVSGHFAPSFGAAFLTVTLKDTRRFNGCAANQQQDEQITLADGGVILTQSEQVAGNSAGAFLSPIALNYRKAARGTGVICAYLNQLFDDVAVGYERFTLPAPKAHKKTKAKKPKKAKSRPKKSKAKKHG